MANGEREKIFIPNESGGFRTANVRKNSAREERLISQGATRKPPLGFEETKGGARKAGTPVTSDALAPQPEPRLTAPEPEQATPTLAANLQAETEASQARRKAEKFSEEGESEIRRQQQEAVQEVLGGETQSELENRFGKEEGLREKDERVIDLEDRLDKQQRALDLRVRNIEDEAGLTASQKNRQIAEVKRKASREMADTAIELNTALKRLDVARNYVNDKVNAVFERQELELEARMFQVENNTEFFTRKEERLLNRANTLEQREIDQQKEEMRQKESVALEVLTNGGGGELAAQVRDAESVEEAFRLGGGFVGLLDRQVQLAQLETLDLNAQIKRKEIEALDTKSIDFRGKRILSPEDADKVEKEIVNSDAFKAIDGVDSVIEALAYYEKVWKEPGLIDILPSERKEKLRAAYGQVRLEAKNLFELGVIAGPDLMLIDNALGGDPSDVGFLDAAISGPNILKRIDNGIANTKRAVLDAVERNVNTLNAVYGDLSREQISILDQVLSSLDEAETKFANDARSIIDAIDSEIEKKSNEDYFNSF